MAPDVGNRCGAFVTPGKFDERDAHQRHGCGDVVRQDAPGRSTVAPAPLLDMGQRRPADLPWCAYPVAQSCAATASDPQIAVNACRVGIFMMGVMASICHWELRMPR
jgi:hypothetical protein